MMEIHRGDRIYELQSKGSVVLERFLLMPGDKIVQPVKILNRDELRKERKRGSQSSPV